MRAAPSCSTGLRLDLSCACSSQRRATQPLRAI